MGTVKNFDKFLIKVDFKSVNIETKDEIVTNIKSKIETLVKCDFKFYQFEKDSLRVLIVELNNNKRISYRDDSLNTYFSSINTTVDITVDTLTLADLKNKLIDLLTNDWNIIVDPKKLSTQELLTTT